MKRFPFTKRTIEALPSHVVDSPSRGSSGIPVRLSTYEKLTHKVILPELPEFNLESATVKETDYLLMN